LAELGTAAALMDSLALSRQDDSIREGKIDTPVAARAVLLRKVRFFIKLNQR
jgi:hypothetical protein